MFGFNYLAAKSLTTVWIAFCSSVKRDSTCIKTSGCIGEAAGLLMVKVYRVSFLGWKFSAGVFITW